jgi:hypothetical protein
MTTVTFTTTDAQDEPFTDETERDAMYVLLDDVPVAATFRYGTEPGWEMLYREGYACEHFDTLRDLEVWVLAHAEEIRP